MRAHVKNAYLAVLQSGGDYDIGIQVVGEEFDGRDLALMGLLPMNHLASIDVGKGYVALSVAGDYQGLFPLEFGDGLGVELHRVDQFKAIEVPDHERMVIAGRQADSVLISHDLRNGAFVRCDGVAAHP